MKKKDKEPLVYNDIPCDSLEELAFCQWCHELQETGFIEKVERGKSYQLTDGYSKVWKETIHLKTKDKIVDKKQVILKPSIYTPDFLIYWNKKGLDKFCSNIFLDIKCDKIFINDIMLTDNHFTTVEVKPIYDQNNMERLCINNQKFLFDKYFIYVNIIKPTDLFEKTFTPKEYLLTTKTKQKRKLNFEVRSLNEYLLL